jgi:Cd2+/Zn2+-exporting ATPase
MSDHAESFELRRELIIAGAGGVLLLLGLIEGPRLHASALSWMEYLIYGTAYLLVGWKVLAAAARGIVRGRIFDENFLMTVATLGAFAIHQLSEAVAVMLFFKVGEILQDVPVDRSRRSISALRALRPDFARALRNGAFVEMKPEEVAVGEQILVRPGERVPLDGTAIIGGGFVDTSALTGEPVPRRVVSGGELLAGFISAEGTIEMRVTHSAGDSSAARIVQLVQGASRAKARAEKFITRFARVYTPVVVIGAALIAFLPPLFLPGATLSTWVSRALTMLVISCPCALVISIPLGYFAGVGGASRKGILVKGAAYLDALAGIRTVVFDKTGTLTQGRFHVRSVQSRNGVPAGDMLRYAALAESHSNHPIAESIRAAAEAGTTGPSGAGGSSIADFRELGGQGVFATVEGHSVMVGNDRLLHAQGISHDTCCVEGTVAHVVLDKRYAGYLVIGDEVRPDAMAAIAGLRRQGVGHVAMLTGDGEETARATAAELGIDEYHADLLPGQKVQMLEQILRERGAKGRTAFVGDGINDAPVLARADVGIAMGASGSDAAVETADVVLMSDSPAKLGEAITRARKTRAVVMQNIVFAIGVKAVFLVLGGFGVATMWEAVIADMGVALAAILNATRAMR